MSKNTVGTKTNKTLATNPNLLVSMRAYFTPTLFTGLMALAYHSKAVSGIEGSAIHLPDQMLS